MGQQRCYNSAAHCGQLWSPTANKRTYISLDCVSGWLLDKDHNMTLFLFCAGSVNRRKAPGAQHAPVHDIDHRPLKPVRGKSFSFYFPSSCNYTNSHLDSDQFFCAETFLFMQEILYSTYSDMKKTLLAVSLESYTHCVCEVPCFTLYVNAKVLSRMQLHAIEMHLDGRETGQNWTKGECR